jgi:CBS domain containing-hemolysin-like protein
MTVSWIAAALAVGSALWGGLMAAAAESPLLQRSLGEAPSTARGSVPVQRAMVMSRIALMLIAGIAGAQAVGWWYRSPREAWVAAAVLAGFLFTVGDGIPRAAASLFPSLASAVAPLARSSLVVFSPLLGLMAWIEGALQRVVPPRDNGTDRYGSARRDMLAGVLSLDETTVAEAMTPRLDVVAVDGDSEWRELVDLLRKSEHARLPVYREDLDDIIGILDAKQLTPAIIGIAPPPDRWLDVVRPATFVPESKLLTLQLGDFKRNAQEMAIVVDEFGGTSGVITVEDVLEEVMGEIYGEYDSDEEPAIRREGEDRLWVDGGVTVDDLAEELGIAFDSDEVSTVGGLVYSALGRVPRPGEELQIASFRVVVERVIRRRIRRVYFERRAEAVREADVQGTA